MANNSLYESLYQPEQFETIFIVIGPFWEFDTLFKDFNKFVDLWYTFLYNSQTKHRLNNSDTGTSV